MKHLFTLLLTAVSLSAQISISNLEELQKIGNDPAFPVTESYILSGDLDASASVDLDGGRGFAPLASEWGKEFTGTFDGAGHSISGLYINRTDMETVGLFSTVGEGGVIKNLKILKADVHGLKRTGILAGYNKGTIENCEIRGKVSSVQMITGGVVGVNGGVANKMTGKVYRCIAVVDVDGGTKMHTGGIAGWCYMGTIEETGVFGTIKGSERSGGLIGGGSGAKLTRSFSLATVSADTTAGGIAGFMTTENDKIVSIVTDCWAGGKVSANSGAGGGIGQATVTVVLNNLYWDYQRTGQDMSSQSDMANGMKTEQMLKAESYPEWKFPDEWKNREGISYPAPAWMEFPVNTVTYEAETGGSLSGELTQELDMMSVGTEVTAASNDGFHFIRWSDNLHDEKRRDAGISSDTTFTAVFREPVPISTFSELEKIGTDSEYPLDFHYYLTGNIDGGLNTMVTLGDNTPLRGTFDGKGFTISNISIEGPLFSSISARGKVTNLKLEGVTTYNPDGYGAILVGLNYGEISTVEIKDSYVYAGNQIAGGLAALNGRGTISNCKVSAEISNDSVVAGGLLGYNLFGTVEQCSFEGTVSADMHAGGLIGYVNGGTITKTSANATVTSKTWAAGGSIGIMLSGYVSNSYAHGDVNGGDTAKDVGGFIGRLMNGGGENCYASAVVNGKVAERTGGFAGLVLQGNFTNSYWNSSVAGVETSMIGTPLNTDEIANSASFVNWDFTDIWEMNSETTLPILRWEQKPLEVANKGAVAKQNSRTTFSILSGNRIALALPEGNSATLSLYQLNGREVFRSENITSGITRLPNTAKGIFLVKVAAKEFSSVKRIHIQ